MRYRCRLFVRHNGNAGAPGNQGGDEQRMTDLHEGYGSESWQTARNS